MGECPRRGTEADRLKPCCPRQRHPTHKPSSLVARGGRSHEAIAIYPRPPPPRMPRGGPLRAPAAVAPPSSPSPHGAPACSTLPPPDDAEAMCIFAFVNQSAWHLYGIPHATATSIGLGGAAGRAVNLGSVGVGLHSDGQDGQAWGHLGRRFSVQPREDHLHVRLQGLDALPQAIALPLELAPQSLFLGMTEETGGGYGARAGLGGREGAGSGEIGWASGGERGKKGEVWNGVGGGEEGEREREARRGGWDGGDVHGGWRLDRERAKRWGWGVRHYSRQ